MQFFPSFWDLSVWLGVVAIILLVTAEIVSLYSGEATLFIEKKRLRIAALILSLLFMLIVVMQVYQIIAFP